MGREEIRSGGVSSFVGAFMITMADLSLYSPVPPRSHIVPSLFFLMLPPLPPSFSHVHPLPRFSTRDHLSRSRWRRLRALSFSLVLLTPCETPRTSRKKIRQEEKTCARHEFRDRLSPSLPLLLVISWYLDVDVVAAENRRSPFVANVLIEQIAWLSRMS